MTPTSITIAEAKEELSDVINRVTHKNERIILTRRGRGIAAIVPLVDLALIEKSQNKNDLEEAVEALKEARSEGTMSLEEFKQHLLG